MWLKTACTIFVLNFVMLLWPVNSRAQALQLTEKQIASIDQLISRVMANTQTPGLAVGIYRRGQVLLTKGYGVARIEAHEPVKPETVFESGALREQFVSAAVMMLVEERKVSLNDSITKYFANAPESWKPIRVANLLSHTSGFSDKNLTSGDAEPIGPSYQRQDNEDMLVEKAEAFPLEFEPGTRSSHSYTNYLLLGVMIHSVTGKLYGEYLRERIFQPLGMTSARLISEGDKIDNGALGYEMHDGRPEPVSPDSGSAADGMICLNVLDLAKWDAALYGTKLLSQSSLDRLWTVYPLDDGAPNEYQVGFGWIVDKDSGPKVVEYSGGGRGFSCSIARYIDDSMTVVVLANLDQAYASSIARNLAELVNPALDPKVYKKKSVDLTPAVLNGYVGKYQASHSLVTITREDGRLFMQWTGCDGECVHPRLQMLPAGDHDFFFKEIKDRITFVVDRHGKATVLVLREEGLQMDLGRVE